jgi:hypothetical protein
MIMRDTPPELTDSQVMDIMVNMNLVLEQFVPDFPESMYGVLGNQECTWDCNAFCTLPATKMVTCKFPSNDWNGALDSEVEALVFKPALRVAFHNISSEPNSKVVYEYYVSVFMADGAVLLTAYISRQLDVVVIVTGDKKIFPPQPVRCLTICFTGNDRTLHGYVRNYTIDDARKEVIEIEGRGGHSIAVCDVDRGDEEIVLYNY